MAKFLSFENTLVRMDRITSVTISPIDVPNTSHDTSSWCVKCHTDDGMSYTISVEKDRNKANVVLKSIPNMVISF